MDFLSFIFQPSCVLCDQDGQDMDLCADCFAQLKRNIHACRQCAWPLPESSQAEYCIECSAQSVWIDQCMAPYLYQPPLDQLIQRFKFQAYLPNGRLLAQLMYSFWPDHLDADILMPVPRHKHKLNQTGLNPSAELCRHLSAWTGIPWSSHALQKIKHTADQHRLNRKQRKKNLIGAFDYRPRRPYSHIVLIDDVITTGTTIKTIAALLRRSGVKKISVWAVARTK